MYWEILVEKRGYKKTDHFILELSKKCSSPVNNLLRNTHNEHRYTKKTVHLFITSYHSATPTTSIYMEILIMQYYKNTTQPIYTDSFSNQRKFEMVIELFMNFSNFNEFELLYYKQSKTFFYTT